MFYIVIDKKNNKVLGSYNFKPSKFDYEKQYLIEADNIPKPGINQYLVAQNITTNTRIIKKAYTEEISIYNEETGINEVKVVEYPQITEDYLTCDFRAVNMPPRVLTEEEKHERYKEEVERLIRLKYSASDVEAMLCNNAKDVVKEEHKIEFEIFQAYRDECKQKARLKYY